MASNKKFYRITRKNRNYINSWLLERISDDKKFLDYCCGEGQFSLFLAKNGANVIGIDISDTSIRIATDGATAQGLKDKANFLIMDGENLKFDDNTFDVVVCSGVLHHLDINKAYPELARVLKLNGEIICNEPLAYNPIFQLYRKLTPHLRTEWEAKHILNKKAIDLAKKYFNRIEMRFYHLSTFIAVPFRNLPFFNFLLSFFEIVDSILLRAPFVKWLSWQIIFILSEPKKSKNEFNLK